MSKGSIIKSALAAVTVVCFCASSSWAMESTGHATKTGKASCAAQAAESKATGGEAAADASKAAAPGAELKAASSGAEVAPAKKHRRRHRKHRRSHRRSHRNRTAHYAQATATGPAPEAYTAEPAAPVVAPVAERIEVKEHSTNDLTSRQRGWKHHTASEATVLH